MNSAALAYTATTAASGSGKHDNFAATRRAAIGGVVVALFPGPALAVAGGGDTPVFALFRTWVVAQRRGNIGRVSDAEIGCLAEVINRTELALARTPAETPRDFAVKAWVAIHSINDTGSRDNPCGLDPETCDMVQLMPADLNRIYPELAAMMEGRQA